MASPARRAIALFGPWNLVFVAVLALLTALVLGGAGRGFPVLLAVGVLCLLQLTVNVALLARALARDGAVAPAVIGIVLAIGGGAALTELMASRAP
jgi:hypothetical protein